MARLLTSGFETGNLQSEGFTYSGGGYVNGVGSGTALSTTTVNTGTYSLRVPAANVAAAVAHNISGVDKRWYWQRCAVYLPSAANAASINSSGGIILDIDTSAGWSCLCFVPNTGVTNIDLAFVSSFNSVSYTVVPNFPRDQWVYVTYGVNVNTAGIDRFEVWIDDVFTFSIKQQWSTATVAACGWGHWSSSPAAGIEYFLDDIALNDDTGLYENSRPLRGKVAHAYPNTDLSVGSGWLRPGGTTTNMFDSVNNVPATGIAHSTSSGNATRQVYNATSTSTSNLDLRVAAYEDLGLTWEGHKVVLTQAYALVGSNNTTDTAGAIRSLDNPADAAETSFTSWETNTIAGTYPTGWVRRSTPVSYYPEVAYDSRPNIRVGKRTATTRVTLITQVGLMVEYRERPAHEETYVNNTVFDDFQRANENPVSNAGYWDSGSQGAVVSNKLVNPTGSGWVNSYPANFADFPSCMWAELDPDSSITNAINIRFNNLAGTGDVSVGIYPNAIYLYDRDHTNYIDVLINENYGDTPLPGDKYALLVGGYYAAVARDRGTGWELVIPFTRTAYGDALDYAALAISGTQKVSKVGGGTLWQEPSTPTLDNFTRANENPVDPTHWDDLSDWGTSAGLQVQSNQLTSTATGQNGAYWLEPFLPTPGQQVEVWMDISAVSDLEGETFLFMNWDEPGYSFEDSTVFGFLCRYLGGSSPYVQWYRSNGDGTDAYGPGWEGVSNGDRVALTYRDGCFGAWKRPSGGDWELLGSVYQPGYERGNVGLVSTVDTIGDTKYGAFGGGIVTSGSGPVTYNINLTESASSAELLARVARAVRSRTDAVTLVENLQRISSQTRLPAESVTTSDAATRVRRAVRTSTDVVSPADALTRGATVTRTRTDSLSLSDLVSRTQALIRGETDLATITESLHRLRIFPRALSDAPVIADSAVRVFGTDRSRTDAVTVSDASSRSSARSKSVANSVITTDAGSRLVTYQTETLDFLPIADALATLHVISRTASDAIQTSEAATFDLFKEIGTQNVVNVTEALAKYHINSRNLIEPLTTDEIALRQGTFTRMVTQPVLVTNASEVLETHPIFITEGLGTSEALVREAMVARGLPDVIVTSELAKPNSTVARGVIDSLLFADTGNRITRINRSRMEAIGVSDGAIRHLHRRMKMSNAVTIADANRNYRTFQLSRVDAIGTHDSLARTLRRNYSLTDSVDVYTAVESHRTLLRSGTDAFGISESIAKVLRFSRHPLESIILQDVPTRSAQFTRLSVQDAIQLFEALATLRFEKPIAHHLILSVIERDIELLMSLGTLIIENSVYRKVSLDQTASAVPVIATQSLVVPETKLRVTTNGDDLVLAAQTTSGNLTVRNASGVTLAIPTLSKITGG